MNRVDPEGACPRSADDAAKIALKEIYEITAKNRWEYAGWIIQNSDGTFTHTAPETQENPYRFRLGIKPKGAVGIYHSHVGGLPKTKPESFSGTHGEPFFTGDRSQGTARKVDVYLITPSGNMKVYRHSNGAEASIGHI